MRRLQLLDQLCSSFFSLSSVRFLRDGQTVDECLGELHRDLLNQTQQRLLYHLVLDIDSRKQLRNDIDPDFQVDLLETLAQFVLDLREITVLEPNFEQAKRCLKGLRRRSCRDI